MVCSLAPHRRLASLDVDSLTRSAEAIMSDRASLASVSPTVAYPSKSKRKLTRLRVGLLAILALLADPSDGEAQQQQNIPRLCFLTFDPGTLLTRSPRFDGFFQGL